MDNLESLSIALEFRKEHGLTFDCSTILEATAISLTYLNLSSLDIDQPTLQVVTLLPEANKCWYDKVPLDWSEPVVGTLLLSPGRTASTILGPRDTSALSRSLAYV